MASRKLTPLEQALKTLRDPDGTGRTTLSHGFSGKPLEQVSGPPNETAAPAYRNGYAAGLAFARLAGERVRGSSASTLEFVRGKWLPAGDVEPHALVTYAAEPSPETGHVGWCWWARGKMGDAPTLAAAMLAAEKNLEGGT